MLKKVFGFLFLGALIVGCACDIHCFIDKQMQTMRQDILTMTTTGLEFCSYVKKSYGDIRSDVKSCSLTKISVNKFEAFTDQMCFDNGTLRKSVLRHEECFGIQGGKALECLSQAGIQAKMEDLDKPYELIKSVCEKIDSIYGCLNSKFRTLCGEDAGNLTQNFTSALSTYTSGICEEINGASLNQVAYVNILGLLYLLLMWHKD